MPNLKDITDPTTAMNMALALMAKAFKLNYSTPTNNNHMISSNLRNRQIAQPGMNMGQERQIQMVGGNGGNQFRQYAGQNVRNLNGYNDVQNIGNQNSNGNGNLVAARAKGNATGQNADLDETEEVNTNCILMANMQQASTSEQSGGIVEQHPATVEETRAYFESIYNNLATEVEQVNSVNSKMKETNADLTTELARYENQEKYFKINQEKYDKLERKITTVSSLQEEKKKLKSDFKIHEDEPLADESLAKHKDLEFKIERLLRAAVSHDIMSIVQTERLAKTQDPLAFMETSNNPYTFPVLHQDQPSFNQNYMQQPMPNLKDITDPTTAMNMALALMAKAFKLNYSTPTNNN
nr:hypothetical protein [Tanacetum cinerariifolium]